MSMYDINVPQADQVDYHAEVQAQRVARALKMIDPSDVLSVIDDRLASQPDMTQHPLYHLVEFLLDRRLACDGGALYDGLKQLVLAAIDTCLDDVLELED